MTFTQTTPPNTNFQSMTPPAGWTCGTSATVGGTGTITCTLAGTLAVNGTANFSLVLQVNAAATPSGTNITDTATATAGKYADRHHDQYRQRDGGGRQCQ